MSYSADFLNICCDVLFEGNDLLGTELGVVACVEDGIYEVVAVVPPNGMFQPGATFLLETTFSQEVLDERRIVVRSEYGGESGLKKHPLYPSLGAELFVGVPIMIENEIWGTVAFSSRTIRTEPFEASAMRMVVAGAAEIAAAYQISAPAAATVQLDLEAAISFEPKEEAPEAVPEQEEPLPGRIIPLPLPEARPRVPAANV